MTLIEDTFAVGQPISAAWLFNIVEGGTAVDAKVQAKEALAHHALANGCLLAGDIVYEVVELSDRRISHIDSSDWGIGTKSVIATDRVTDVLLSEAQKVEARGRDFMSSLSQHDLHLLRAETRKVAKLYGRTLTSAQCDAIIMECGPEAAESMIRRAVDGR